MSQLESDISPNSLPAAQRGRIRGTLGTRGTPSNLERMEFALDQLVYGKVEKELIFFAGSRPQRQGHRIGVAMDLLPSENPLEAGEPDSATKGPSVIPPPVAEYQRAAQTSRGFSLGDRKSTRLNSSHT